MSDVPQDCGSLPWESDCESLTEWARHALGPLGQAPAAHHHLLLNELGRIAAGDCDRLMLLMPPGSAKSTYASILFPAWWFTRHPRSSIVAASHTADLASHFGRQVRDIVADHGEHLGYGLAAGSRAAGRWCTSAGGDYFATGVRGPITGRRADLVIIDDPVKSYADADSQTHRDLIWNWYRADLITRLRPGGRIVLIMTRWHDDDLGGRLLAEHADEWRVLKLPALAEADDPLGRAIGAPLWPDWESEEELHRKRVAVGYRVWSALYQQTPKPPEGGLFNIRPIIFRDEPPEDGQSVRAWDLAVTPAEPGKNPDWTVGIRLHRAENNHFTVTDVVRLRGSALEVGEAMVAAARADGSAVKISVPKDPGAGGGFASTFLTGRLAGHQLILTAEKGSKSFRAAPVAAQIEAGNLSIVRAPWNRTFVEELRDFPYGAKDDQVDALSLAFAALVDLGPPPRRLNVSFLAR